jgi:hypothetical protein
MGIKAMVECAAEIRLWEARNNPSYYGPWFKHDANLLELARIEDTAIKSIADGLSLAAQFAPGRHGWSRNGIFPGRKR